MKTISWNYYFNIVFIGVLLSVNSCVKDNIEEPQQEPESGILGLKIPETFNFETSRNVEILFNDYKSSKSGNVKYDIYLYSDEYDTEVITYEDEGGTMVTDTVPIYDVLNNIVATAFSDDGQFTMNLTIPVYYEYLYIIRNEFGAYTSEIIPIENNKTSYKRSFSGVSKDDPLDVIYGVNSAGDVFTINPVTGEMVIIDQYPSGHSGSVTCALDPINRIMYTIVSNTKWLLAYDVDNNTWDEIGYTGLSGPRLEYRKEDGLLYFSTGNLVMTVDPSTGGVISTYTVNGLHNSGWGDVAFDQDGELFMTTYSGLYRCNPSGNNTYQATRISADNLPFRPTSMTFDSNGELWIGSNEPNGQVVVMDQVTGGWEFRFQNMITKINDLTFLPLDETQIEELDSDGDGIVDFYDEYPDDANRAYDNFTPSIYGWGSYAFEDLWPNEGDYDFNDLVLNYRYTNVLNSNDQVVETIMVFKLKNIGGSHQNGFGIEMGFPASYIQEVNGCSHNQGIVSVNNAGLETGQSNPVIIVFENAWNLYKAAEDEIEVVITYALPVNETEIMNYNPFIFINGERGREVHLANFPPTSLADISYFGSADDTSDPAIGRYYKNPTNLPWAINIIHDFVYPVEKIEISLGYTKFANWAESGGNSYQDWYKDQDDYRNTSFLVIN